MATLERAAALDPSRYRSPFQHKLPPSPPLNYTYDLPYCQEPSHLRDPRTLPKEPPWLGFRTASCDYKDLMSHQSGSASGLPKSGSQDDARNLQYNADTPQPSPIRPPMRIVPNEPHLELGPGQGRTLTPLSNPTENSPPFEGRSSGPLGMRSILNPQPLDMPPPYNRRRSAAQMESPSPTDSVSAVSLPPISRTSSREPEQQRTLHPIPPRRILNTRSPSLHRATSLIFNQPETGSIDARSSPFIPLPGTHRPQPIQPTAQHVPALSTPPANLGRSDYFSRPGPTPPPTMMASNHRSASVGMLHSASVTSASQAPTLHRSNNRPSPGTLPPSRYGTPNHSESASGTMGGPPLMEDGNPYGIPVVSAQSNYQLLTLNTQQGHAIQIPVEVQAGSRQADEKRKRNAGASARFRARRKEKEKEASETIARLEEELKERDEDVDFYRNERDVLLEVIHRQGLQAHFPLPRPQSPHVNRPSHDSPQPEGQPSEAKTPAAFDQSSEHPAESERNVRRRTSAYVAPVAVPEQGSVVTPTQSNQPFHARPSLQPQPLAGLHVARTREFSPKRMASLDPNFARYGANWPPQQEKHSGQP